MNILIYIIHVHNMGQFSRKWPHDYGIFNAKRDLALPVSSMEMQLLR